MLTSHNMAAKRITTKPTRFIIYLTPLIIYIFVYFENRYSITNKHKKVKLNEHFSFQLTLKFCTIYIIIG